MAKCNPVFIVTLPSEKVRDEAGGRGGGEGRWGERASVREERERGLIFEEYGVVFDVQVLSRLCSFCLPSACFHRSAVKQKTKAYLAQLI